MTDIEQTMDHFVVYRTADGGFQWQSAGPAGTAMATSEKLPAGLSVLKLPFDVYVSLPDDMGPLRAMAEALIDQGAGAFRGRFITTIPGQAETYLYKAAEARAWQADNSVATPMMTPEADARGLTIASLAAEVLAREAAWLTLGGRIEGHRLSAKEAVRSAASIGAIVEAMTVDWSDALPSPAAGPER